MSALVLLPTSQISHFCFFSGFRHALVCFLVSGAPKPQMQLCFSTEVSNFYGFVRKRVILVLLTSISLEIQVPLQWTQMDPQSLFLLLHMRH